MIERVLENWLDKASERSYQVPFAQSLIAEGYTVLHITRHCGLELGKDILAIDPQGQPCAYQLKNVSGKRISLAQWRAEIAPQMLDLTMGKIVHPSLTGAMPHRSFLVVSGGFEEEVLRAIDDFNRAREEDGNPGRKLNIIVKGQLLKRFIGLQSDLWPVELADEKLLLELYLTNGAFPLPKHTLSSLMEGTLRLNKLSETDKPTEHARRISSLIILTGLATSAFSIANNHVAEFQAWLICAAHILGLAERLQLDDRFWRAELSLSLDAMYNALGRLTDELKSRRNLVEGDPFSDPALRSVRIGEVIGWLSLMGLWRRWRNELPSEEDDFLAEFCRRTSPPPMLVGEYAVPLFLARYFYLRTITGTAFPDFYLGMLLRTLTTECAPSGEGIPGPYYEPDEILRLSFENKLAELDDRFAGCSFSAEGVLHLVVRRGWKSVVRELWPDVSRLTIRGFIPEHTYDHYRWR